MPRQRHEYVFAFADREITEVGVLPAGLVMRRVEPADLLPMAELMLDAYRSTIDYEGETLSEAVAEVQRYFSSTAEDPPLLGHSVLLTSGLTLRCSCLVKQWHYRQCPLIGYIMCHPAWKGRGLAALALAESLHLLKEAGFSQVRAFITEGNVPSERLFLRAGFTRLASV
jgi:RimJ/RimL family protein N-acetyltransferase